MDLQTPETMKLFGGTKMLLNKTNKTNESWSGNQWVNQLIESI